MKKDIKILRYKDIRGKVKPWVGDKIAEARKLGEHRAARAARRWGAPAGVALVVFILIGSFFIPKDSFQQAKHSLLKNSGDFQAQLVLAEELLANNQFEEAEKALLVAEQINQSANQPINQLTNNVLGEQVSSKLEELWQRKYYSDPEDIKKLITIWEKIIKEKTGYRDGYLQLAYLHYKLYENEKAKEYLKKALELDPNYEPAKELEKILGD